MIYPTPKNDQEKANILQKFFSSVFTEESPGDLPHFEKRKYDSELNDLLITTDMVKKKLLKIKVNKSPGPDQIHPRVLHETTSSIIEPLTIIFNTSIQTKKLPSEWKEANVSAIYKKGNKSPPNNYRPVSLTAIICKILESIVRDHVINHMKQNKLFSANQFGFITGRSTMLQLLKVLDIWTQIFDQGGTIDVIYCDFMKAFDKVPHRRLIHKVKQHGIAGNTLGWIENFLHNRSQVTVINYHKSHTAPVTSGIPQGSVLGPILFVIYINDLPETVDPSSHIFLFADDTKVFREINCIQDRQILQKDIDNMLAWSKKWLLKFHPEKCVMMSLGKNSAYSKENHIYQMEGHNLNYSNCEKDLGVYIDEELSFDIDICQAINKANRVMAIARKTFDFMNEDIFLNIFKGLVRPHLEYATAVWSPHLIEHIDDLENVQRRATKKFQIFHLCLMPNG